MIRAVSYAAILDDPNWPKLLEEYSAECSLPELGPAVPQRELYATLEASGGFQAFGVYGAGGLVGFATVLVYVLPHYGKKIATTESIFVAKEYTGVTPALLMLNLHEHARNSGCSEFMYSAPKGSRFDQRLSQSKTARHTNNVYLVKL